MGAEAFAKNMKVLMDAGADIVGGCCGTTPEFIKALKKKSRKKNDNQVKDTSGKIHFWKRFLCIRKFQ